MAFINKSKVLSGLKEEIFSPNIGEEAVVHSLFLSNTSDEVVTVEVYLKNNSENSEVLILKPTLKAGEFFSLSKNINLSSLDSLSIEPSQGNVVTCMLSVLKQGMDGVSTSISLNPRGAFVDGATYNKLDMVSHLGSSYVALVDNVTTTPVAGADWGIVASNGSGSISSLFEDNTPKLSNNLDMNGFTLVNSPVVTTKATLDKSFQANEAYLMTLDNSQDCAIVNVQKEEPQLGIENRLWHTGVNPYTFDIPNEAYSDSLTITELYDEVTLTLDTLNWSENDIGKYIKVASGACYITDVNSNEAYGKVIDTINSGTYTAGEWEMYSATFTENGLTLAYGVTSGEGFDLDTMKKTRLVAYVGTYGGMVKVMPSGYESCRCIAVSDGKLYTNNSSSNTIYQWDMPKGTINSITATTATKAKTLAELTGGFNFTFADEGKRLYCVDHSNGKVFQYNLTIPYNIATIAYTNKTFTAYHNGSNVEQTISISSDGKYLYLQHQQDYIVRRYELSIPYDIISTRILTTSMPLSSMPFNDTKSVNILRAIISDNGRELVGYANYHDGTYQNNCYSIPLSVAYDVTTIPNDKFIRQISPSLGSDSGMYYTQPVFYKGNMYYYSTYNYYVYAYTFESTAIDYNIRYCEKVAIDTQDPLATSVIFNNDGSKLYLSGATENKVFEYSLSVPFKISTRTYVQELSVASLESQLKTIRFNRDGTVLYIGGLTSDTIYALELSTAWDISTANVTTPIASIDVSAQQNGIMYMIFSNNGKKLFCKNDNSTYDVYVYNLSIGFDLSTAVYDTKYNVLYSEQGIMFSPNGNTLITHSGPNFYFYSLKNPYDISTINTDYNYVQYGTYNMDNSAILNATASCLYATLANDGNIYFLSNLNSRTLYKLLADFTNMDRHYYAYFTDSPLKNTSINCFTFNEDGSKLLLVKTNTLIEQYSLSKGFNTRTSVYDNITFDMFNQLTAVNWIRFSPDGTKLFACGYLTSGGSYSKRIVSYNCSIPFSIEGLTAGELKDISSNFGSTTSPSPSPISFDFNADGTMITITQSGSTTFYNYILTTPYLLSTMGTGTSGTSVGTNSYLQYANNGYNVYVYATNITGGYAIGKYSLSIPYNFSTAVFVGSISPTVGSPSNKFFIPQDGKKIIFSTGPRLLEVPFSSEESLFVSNQYVPVLTSDSGKIDTNYWADINNITITDFVGSQEAMYTFSTDGKNTWKIANAVNGVRVIAKNDSGTWKYNSNTSYTAETFTAATTNTVIGALKEAMNIEVNKMTSAQAKAVTTAVWFPTGYTLDMAVILYTNDSNTSPIFNRTSINYDANSVYSGAKLGSDYEYQQVNGTNILFKSLTQNNLKVRVI